MARQPEQGAPTPARKVTTTRTTTRTTSKAKPRRSTAKRATTTTTTPAPAATTTVTPKIDAGTLAVDYGFAMAVLNSNPDLKRIFNQAVAQTWSGDKFIAELRGTSWFKRTSDTARQWSILVAADPATAAARRKARLTTLTQEAAQLGVKMTTAQFWALRDNSLMFGWTDQQVRQVMGAAWKFSPTTPQAGLAGQTVAQLRQTAQDYAVPISNNAINSWTQKTLEGLATPDDFKNYAIDQAKSLFPTMTDQIDKGMTVDQIADPYRQTASQLLGINPADVDFMQPKWREAIDKVDPTTGKRTVQSLADWQTQVRSDTRYGYDKTAGARQQASQLTDTLAKTFGFEG